MKRSSNLLLILLALLLLSNCKEEKCEFKSMQLMETIQSAHGNNVSYAHRVLVKDYPKSCFDSLTAVQLYNAYMEEVKEDKPVDAVLFHNSGEWYYNPSTWVKDAREDSDQIDDHLVTVRKDNDEYEFVFYDDDMNMIYKGPNWKN